jgi:D-arabinose 1-dehydrogenase-like Zn-dependent alcohol dehydrogenase
VYDGIGAVESGIKCLRYRGRLVVVGFAARGGKVESVRMNRILLKGVAVFGYVSLLPAVEYLCMKVVC